MEQKKFYIFFTSQRNIGQKLLLDWSKKKGITLIIPQKISEFDFRNQWNRLVQSSHIGIQVDYPIVDTFDLKTLELFLDHVQSHPGQWYYAPRPNAYLQVQKPALVGMNPMIPVKYPIKTTILEIGTRGLSSSWLPCSSRRILKSLAIKMWNKCFNRATNKSKNSSSQKDIYHRGLQVAVPENLRPQAANWQSWIPNLNTLKRDLLERIEYFFPHPMNIHVILLNKCNLKCIMCPYHAPKYILHHTSGYFHDVKLMSEEVFQKIADYAGKYKIYLQFGQIEEPLMHKKIFDFFKLAKKKGVPYIHMTTNGTLLDYSKAERLSRTGIDSVMFSIDATKPETYKEIRGKNLYEVEENIKYFLPLAKKNGIRVTVSFIMQPEARYECDQFLEKWRQIGVNSVTYYVLGKRDPQSGIAFRNGDLYDKGERYPCASPWTQSVVFPDGEVSLCCKTMGDVGWRGVVSVGNLQDQSFENIWRDEGYTRVRNELLEKRFNEFDVCSDCQIWSATNYIQEKHETYIRVYNETMETYTFF